MWDKIFLIEKKRLRGRSISNSLSFLSASTAFPIAIINHDNINYSTSKFKKGGTPFSLVNQCYIGKRRSPLPRTWLDVSLDKCFTLKYFMYGSDEICEIVLDDFDKDIITILIVKANL